MSDESEFSLEGCRKCLADIAEQLPRVTAADASEEVRATALPLMSKSLQQLNWMMSSRQRQQQQQQEKGSTDDPLWTIEKEMLDSGLVSGLVDLLVALLGNQAGNDLAIRVLLRLLTATDRSLDFCLGFLDQEKFFTTYFPSLLNGQDGEQMLELETVGMVECAIGTAFNMYFKNHSEMHRRLTEYGLVKCTRPYLASPVTRVSATALILIAFAVDESQAEIFLGAKKNINYLISLLRLGLKAPERSCDGYSVMELAKCINKLALNDANKDLLIELNVLSVVKLLLDSPNSQDVQEGLEILFTLSFSDKNARRIWTEFRPSIERLAGTERWRNCRQLRGLQFRLGGLKHPVATPAAEHLPASAQPEDTRHRVMISYNHGSRQQVEKLHRRLSECRLEAWVDFQHLKDGSTLDAMSEAVEAASVVLLCVSRLYKESNNCRLEAEYAWKCGKKLIPLLMEPKYRATGWLGMLMGTQLYFDLTETKCSFEEKFSQLLPVIRGHLLAADPSPVVASAAASAAASVEVRRREHRLPTPPPPPPLPPIVAGRQQHQQHHQQPAGVAASTAAQLRSWDAHRVAAWCRERRLPETVSSQGLTGQELHFLLDTRARSPEFFGRLLEKYFELPRLCDMAALVAALDSLAVMEQQLQLPL